MYSPLCDGGLCSSCLCNPIGLSVNPRSVRAGRFQVCLEPQDSRCVQGTQALTTCLIHKARGGQCLISPNSSLTSDSWGHPVSVGGMSRHHPDECCLLPVFLSLAVRDPKIHPLDPRPLN